MFAKFSRGGGGEAGPFLARSLFNESLDFATLHSLLNYIDLIDSCQVHVHVQDGSNTEFIRQK